MTIPDFKHYKTAVTNASWYWQKERPISQCNKIMSVEINLWSCNQMMANKYMKECSMSFSMKEIQIKTTLTVHLTSIIMGSIKKTNKNKCW
jgi:hypothetical protein